MSEKLDLAPGDFSLILGHPLEDIPYGINYDINAAGKLVLWVGFDCRPTPVQMFNVKIVVSSAPPSQGKVRRP
ncbi:hypothetical protein D3C86_1611180 [compost metagenome]